MKKLGTISYYCTEFRILLVLGMNTPAVLAYLLLRPGLWGEGLDKSSVITWEVMLRIAGGGYFNKFTSSSNTLHCILVLSNTE